MIYGNKEIADIYYGGHKIKSVYLGKTKVFGSQFKAFDYIFLIDGELYIGLFDCVKVDSGVTDVSRPTSYRNSIVFNHPVGVCYYIKDQQLYRVSFDEDGHPETPVLLEDLGRGWTAVYNDKFEIYSTPSYVVGYDRIVGIRNGHIISGLDTNNTHIYADWIDDLRDPSVPSNVKAIFSDYEGNSSSIKSSAYALTTDGVLWVCSGADGVHASTLDTGGKVTDIRREEHYISYICNRVIRKKSKFGWDVVKETNSDRFSKSEWGLYEIIDGKVYYNTELMTSDASSNFCELSGPCEMYALTANGEVYDCNHYSKELVKRYPIVLEE